MEVLAALASVLCSWAVTGILVAEAVHRIVNPTPVDGKLMFFLALAGIAVNILNLLILGGHHHHGVGGHDHDHGHSHDDAAHSHGSSGHNHGSDGHSHEHDAHGHDDGNINLRGAVIHVLGDFVQSIGVAAAGALIWWKQVRSASFSGFCACNDQIKGISSSESYISNNQVSGICLDVLCMGAQPCWAADFDVVKYDLLEVWDIQFVRLLCIYAVKSCWQQVCRLCSYGIQEEGQNSNTMLELHYSYSTNTATPIPTSLHRCCLTGKMVVFELHMICRMM